MESMEAPTPFKPQASFEKQCSIKIDQNNMTYILNFGIVGESVYFELYDTNNENYKYINISSLNSLKKSNFWFNQFSSLEKLIKILKNIMNSNKFKIKESKNDIKVIYFCNPLDEEDIIYLELKKEEKSEKEIIKELLNTVKELKEKNEFLENKINNLEIIEKENREKILVLEKQIKDTNKKLGEPNFINSENTLDSLIVLKKEDIKLLKEWISPNQKISFELIYRATRDGDTTKDFHRMCDNKAPMIFLFKTPKEYIFGGYTTTVLNNPDNKDFYLKDDKAFVFSLNSRAKYNTKDKNKSIAIYNNFLIIFGNGNNSIQIENNALASKTNWSNPHGSYGDNLNLTESMHYSIVEMEVYLVKFL